MCNRNEGTNSVCGPTLFRCGKFLSFVYFLNKNYLHGLSFIAIAAPTSFTKVFAVSPTTC